MSNDIFLKISINFCLSKVNFLNFTKNTNITLANKGTIENPNIDPKRGSANIKTNKNIDIPLNTE